MKRVLQDLRTGRTVLEDVPAPAVRTSDVLVRTHASVISAGTERMLVAFGRASLLEKARSQPDKVRQVLQKARTDGVLATLDAVRSKLAEPMPLGYCQAGTVVAVGSGVRTFCVGDRVATNGGHAEVVRVPQLLCAAVPPAVEFSSAAFTPLASVALHGIRLANVTLGETVVVFGLGLVGLLAVQILRASGCRVLGIDRDEARLRLGADFGAEPVERGADVVGAVHAATGGVGADAVLLALAAESDEPIRRAAEMSRKRGRLVLIGVTGLKLSRDLFYKKELSFTVSCSYGPGRYDPAYEDGSADYPLPYVRWTEQRNFEAVLRLMAEGALTPEPLISHRFPFDRAPEAYDEILGASSTLGVLLDYPEVPPTVASQPDAVRVVTSRPRSPAGAPTVGVIGAGGFATRVLLPALRRAGADLHTVVSSGGTSAALAAKRFGFRRAGTDPDAVLDDADIRGVVIATRHDSHARLVARALRAGKTVFVEKPLALTHDDLNDVADALSGATGSLLVGFNRRFAPLTATVRAALRGRVGPAVVSVTVNAGSLPPDHWSQDPAVGGGRVVGEVCHFVDLVRAIVGASIRSVTGVAALDGAGASIDDVASFTLRLADGSLGLITYLANGSRSFPKERVEVFADGRVWQIDNWRRLRSFGGNGPLLPRPRRQDKGHTAEVAAWIATLRDGTPLPVSAAELIEVSEWTIRMAERLRGPDA